jgi:hypothetical protein
MGRPASGGAAGEVVGDGSVSTRNLPEG